MLTVIFATRNGMRTLPYVLDAYLRLQLPEGGWKLVVVDNGSIDSTREIVASYSDRLPLTPLCEETPGKNAALNAALARIEGDLVVLTDDDALPDPAWLVRMRSAADSQPAFSLFGGVVLPRWQTTPPDWVVNWVPPQPVFTITPPTLQEGPIDNHFVVGPNMAVRSELFASGLRFDPTIGPRGTSYAMGSETEFVQRLGRLGYPAWHVAGAKVEHLIRDFQTTRSWILRRAVRLGRGMYRLGKADSTTELPEWFGIPRYLFKETAGKVALLGKGLLTLRGETIFRAQWDLNVLLGQMSEAYRARR